MRWSWHNLLRLRKGSMHVHGSLLFINICVVGLTLSYIIPNFAWVSLILSMHVHTLNYYICLFKVINVQLYIFAVLEASAGNADNRNADTTQNELTSTFEPLPNSFYSIKGIILCMCTYNGYYYHDALQPNIFTQLNYPCINM